MECVGFFFFFKKNSVYQVLGYTKEAIACWKECGGNTIALPKQKVKRKKEMLGRENEELALEERVEMKPRPSGDGYLSEYYNPKRQEQKKLKELRKKPKLQKGKIKIQDMKKIIPKHRHFQKEFIRKEKRKEMDQLERERRRKELDLYRNDKDHHVVKPDDKEVHIVKHDDKIKITLKKKSDSSQKERSSHSPKSPSLKDGGNDSYLKKLSLKNDSHHHKPHKLISLSSMSPRVDVVNGSPFVSGSPFANDSPSVNDSPFANASPFFNPSPIVIKPPVMKLASTTFKIKVPKLSSKTFNVDEQTLPSASQYQSPTQSSPTQSSPTQSLPTQSSPTQSSPTQSSPTQSLPTQLLPTQSSPTQSLPTQLLPTQLLPTQSLPTPTMSPSVKGKIIIKTKETKGEQKEKKGRTEEKMGEIVFKEEDEDLFGDGGKQKRNIDEEMGFEQRKRFRLGDEGNERLDSLPVSNSEQSFEPPTTSQSSLSQTPRPLSLELSKDNSRTVLPQESYQTTQPTSSQIPEPSSSSSNSLSSTSQKKKIIRVIKKEEVQNKEPTQENKNILTEQVPNKEKKRTIIVKKTLISIKKN
jgi:hypothetical protein